MSMKLLASIFILMAALGSAVWNIHVKKSDNKITFVTLMVIPQLIIALPVMFMVAGPSLQSLGYICASAFMQTGYIIFLSYAYTHGMMSRVYPLAIGTAPLLSLVFSHVFLQKIFSGYEYLGILILSVGIMGFTFVVRHPLKGFNWKALGFAFVTSVFISGYSLIDTAGIRTVANPATYISWLFAIKGFVLLLPMLWMQRISYIQLIEDKKKYIIAGLLAGIGYAVAIWAFLYAPTAVVLALRATSILFVFLLSIFILKERASLLKLVLTSFVILGVYLVLIS